MLVVDPYMDETALSDFVLMVPEGVPIRLLSDNATVKPTLRPARDRWLKQYSGFGRWRLGWLLTACCTTG